MAFNPTRYGWTNAAGERFFSIEDIRNANRDAGFYWFSPDTLRFFRSRILSGVYSGTGGVFFVSSESRDGAWRTYNVRRFLPESGNVESTAFRAYRTAEGAKRAAKRAAKGEV